MKYIFQTPGYSGTNVRFSPFISNMFACASQSVDPRTGQSCGALYILDHFPEDISSPIKCYRSYRWPSDRLLDVAWSESHEGILWSASGDGYVQVWDINRYLPVENLFSDFDPYPLPVKRIKCHDKEITSVEWSKNHVDTSTVLTSSFDDSVKLWEASVGELVNTFESADTEVNCTAWSPFLRATFAAGSNDGYMRIWNTGDSCLKPFIEVKSCMSPMLSCRWSKNNEHLIIAGSRNGCITAYDIRYPVGDLFQIQGHQKAIKKIKFNPHQDHVFATVSDDNTTKLWDTEKHDHLLVTFNHHSDSVCGLDFNSHVLDEMVDCGKDSLVYVYFVNSSFGVKARHQER